MTYEEFLESFLKELKLKLDDADQIELRRKGYCSYQAEETEEIRKCNLKYAGIDSPVLIYDFFLIHRQTEGMTRGMRICAEREYEFVEKYGMERAIANIVEQEKNFVGNNSDFSSIAKRENCSYEDIREQLIVRPLNYEKYQGELNAYYVFRHCGEVALVLYQLVHRDRDMLITSRINRDELVHWGKNCKEVMQEALENTARLFPPVVYDDHEKDGVSLLDREDAPLDLMPAGYALLSNSIGQNGAVSIFYPGVIEKMMKWMNGPFYAVFMNTMDVMLLPLDTRLLQKCMLICRKDPEFGEYLSDKCYLCTHSGIKMMK